MTKMTIAYQRDGVRCNPIQRYAEIASPAKVNLFLEILGKRADGFHELETVMVTVGIFDRLRLSSRDDGKIRLKLQNPSCGQNIPTDQGNLIVQALLALREFSFGNQLPGCDVLLYKRIPSEAGLGGASSNAAAALLAGRLLWNLKISDSSLMKLAIGLGSDVPFFMFGGTAMCRGRGERIETLPSTGGIPIVIVKPPLGLSTREVFSQVQLSPEMRPSSLILSRLLTNQIELIGQQLYNRLTETAVKLNQQIAEIANHFAQTTAVGHQMSGSGSSYFGIFRSMRTARQAAQLLSNRLPQASIYLSQTLGRAQSGLPATRPL